MKKYYTPQEIAEARLSYADHHGVDYASGVEVTEHHHAGKCVGFRLSLDVDGVSHGADEWHGLKPTDMLPDEM